MLQMANVGPSDFVIDLGSGDGRIAVAAGKLGARAFGVDIDPQRDRGGAGEREKGGVQDKVTFRAAEPVRDPDCRRDRAHHVPADQGQMDLRPRILDELKPGTRVVSHAFNLGDWQPDKHARSATGRSTCGPCRPKWQGRWRVQNGAESFSLDLEQKSKTSAAAAQARRQSGRRKRGPDAKAAEIR